MSLLCLLRGKAFGFPANCPSSFTKKFSLALKCMCIREILAYGGRGSSIKTHQMLPNANTVSNGSSSYIKMISSTKASASSELFVSLTRKGLSTMVEIQRKIFRHLTPILPLSA